MKRQIKIVGISIAVLIVLMVIGGVYIYYRPNIKPLVVYKHNGTYRYKVYEDYAVLQEYNGNETHVVIADKVLGRKVTHISNIAFMENEYIQSVKCPKYLKQIGGAAFEGCPLLSNVELNKELEVLESGVFQKCPSLKEIEIYDKIQIIGGEAFEDSGLEKVKIYSDKVFIDRRAFYNTPWLNNQEGFAIYGDNILIGYQGTDEVVVVPEGVKVLSGCFFDDKQIKEVYLPNTVESILSHTFWHCEDITVYIPNSVKNMTKGMIGLPEELTIVTTAGSYAESFAKENDIEYKIVDEIIYPEVN